MAFSKVFEISTDELIQSPQPVFNSHHQQGGHANNYIVNNGLEAALIAKDEVIAAKNEVINLLKTPNSGLGALSALGLCRK